MRSIIQYLTESPTVQRPSTLVDLKRYNFELDYGEAKEFNRNDSRLLLNKKATNNLLKAQNLLPKGYRFIISSGYRGYDEQVQINEYMKKKFKKKYPNNWEKMLDKFTGGENYLEYLRTHKSKFSYMSHASGNAVDIVGIINQRKQKLDLGKQTNTNKDQLDYYKNKRSLNPKEKIIKDNREIFKKVLEKNHFDNYKDEWWHWGYYK